MIQYIIGMADFIHKKIKACSQLDKRRTVESYSKAGDAQFSIDKVAEDATREFATRAGVSIALFTEDGDIEIIGKKPEYLLLVDPIDGTRPAAADLEMSSISIAVSRYTDTPRIKDVEYAVLMETKTGATIYGEKEREAIQYSNHYSALPNLSKQTSLKHMFWSFEYNGHPVQMMTDAYGHLIDMSANNGGVFIFNSATYSISRIITGQLDAYVDIGNRLLKDKPERLGEFERVGNGKVLHLFPYDIAAAVFLAEKSGVVISDGYGKSLEDTLLVDLSIENQQSCIAASNVTLHEAILKNIKW